MPLTGQLSLFGAEAADPSVADLAGLLAGGARLSRMGGTARLSVEVDAAWRVHVLAAEFALRGVDVSWQRLPGDEATARPRFEVLTAYTSRLAPLARTRRFWLNGARLRLWVAAGGRTDGDAVLLSTPAEAAGAEAADPAAAPVVAAGAVLSVETVGAALARLGLPARVVDEPPVFRIAGRRRIARLAELLGDRPAAAPPQVWPTVE